MALAACDQSAPLDPAHPNQNAVSAAVGEVPERNVGGKNPWRPMADAELWGYVSQRDSLVNVGLKSPGARRGIWRSEVLVTLPDRSAGLRAIAGIPGLSVIKPIRGLPAIQVKVASLDALATLRRIPFADYVEPNALGGGYASTAPSSGCGYDSRTPNTIQTALGDYIPPHFRREDSQIERAWNRVDGSGVTLGLIDTGISPWQDELLRFFEEGGSASRWGYLRAIDGLEWWGDCSHGTKMAGTMAAPMNGRSVVGAAWNSNLISVHQANKVFGIDGADAAEALHIAASELPASVSIPAGDRRVIAMAWQSNDSDVIRDVIEGWHAQNRLFVAASGTVDYSGIAFPADMPEVVAVSAVTPDYYGEIDGLNYGGNVELTFPVDQLTVGEYLGDISNLGGTSGATAAVSGIAALVWSKYPYETNEQIRTRLVQSAHNYPSRDRVVGFGVPNAMRASGGMWSVRLNGCTTAGVCEQIRKLSTCQSETFTLSPQGGDGPYSYNWGSGSWHSNNSVTLNLCPTPGQEEYYSLTGSVLDTSDGTSISRTVRVKVLSAEPGACETCPA